MLESFGLILLLVGIVWLSYRYYGTPESEYLNVLDQLHVEEPTGLDTEVVKKDIDMSIQKLSESQSSGAPTTKEAGKEHLRLALFLLRQQRRTRRGDQDELIGKDETGQS